MERKPRIGITSSFEHGRQTLDLRYVEAVEAAGGIPVIVPLLQTVQSAADFAALLDGLIITGGPGIRRGLIGALPDDLPPVDPRRDRSDALIFRAMADRPFLGICYGMQFANAMACGAIYGDAQAQARAAGHSVDRGGGEHVIRISANSHLQAVLKTDQLMTNSHHIQAVAAVGEGLVVTARTADGVIEALESEHGRIVGVQFHPERMAGAARALFADLISRAKTSQSGA